MHQYNSACMNKPMVERACCFLSGYVAGAGPGQIGSNLILPCMVSDNPKF